MITYFIVDLNELYFNIAVSLRLIKKLLDVVFYKSKNGLKASYGDDF